MKNKKWIFIVFLLVVVISGGWFFFNRSGKVWKTEQVKTQNLKDIVDISGMVVSVSDVTLKAGIQGEITSRYLKENQRVKRGAALLKMDASQLSLQNTQAKVNSRLSQNQNRVQLQGAQKSLKEAKTRKSARLENLEHQLKKNQTNLKYLSREWLRTETLFNEKVLSKEQFLKAEEQLKQVKLDIKNLNEQLLQVRKDNTEIITAQNQLNQAQVALTMARKQGHVNTLITQDQLGKTLVRAPFEGSVTQWMVNVGDYVMPGNSLARFQDLKNRQLEVNVNELDYPKVKPGNLVEILFDAYPEQVFKGKVSKLSEASILSVDSLQVFPVKIIFTDPNYLIKPGMSGDAKITVQTRNKVVAIPINAVSKKENNYWISVLENEKLVSKKVVPGLITLEFLEIKQGLKSGEILVLNPPKED